MAQSGRCLRAAASITGRCGLRSGVALCGLRCSPFVICRCRSHHTSLSIIPTSPCLASKWRGVCGATLTICTPTPSVARCRRSMRRHSGHRRHTRCCLAVTISESTCSPQLLFVSLLFVSLLSTLSVSLPLSPRSSTVSARGAACCYRCFGRREKRLLDRVFVARYA